MEIELCGGALRVHLLVFSWGGLSVEGNWIHTLWLSFANW
jgi:hypothetical protein